MQKTVITKYILKLWHWLDHSTGKSVSEALILELVNPQYDERLFIEFPKSTSSKHVVYKYYFECENKTKTK